MKETVFLSLIAFLSVLSLVLLLVQLLRKNKDSVSEEFLTDIQKKYTAFSERISVFSENVDRHFSQNRMEDMQKNAQLRNEVKGSLDNMNELLKRTISDSYEQRIQTTKAISTALEDIRRTNSEQNEKQNNILQQSIEKMQKGNEEKLDQMRQVVDEKLNSTLTERLDSSFKTVSQQLENVYKSLGEMKVLSGNVTDNVASLNRVLTNVKARGTWAEVQLESILDQTIPGMFDKNVMTNPGSREIVEFAVKIPSSEDKDRFVYIPIDSKFPMEDYIRLCDAADRADSQAVEELRKNLERRVLGFAKDISKYIHEPETTPFAIMYLATEGLYSEIISSKSAVAERIHNEYNVMVSGPSTITALLNSLAMGFKAIAINEKAREVRELLAAAKTQYEKFGDTLAKAKKKIEEAGKTLDDAQKRNNIIQKNLRSVEEIDSGVASELLGIED